MAEPAKASGNKKVLWLRPGEGGVHMPPFDAQTYLVAKRPDGRMASNGVPDLEMELDKSLGGIVIRYTANKEPHTVLCPMGNVRSCEFAE